MQLARVTVNHPQALDVEQPFYRKYMEFYGDILPPLAMVATSAGIVLKLNVAREPIEEAIRRRVAAVASMLQLDGASIRVSMESS